MYFYPIGSDPYIKGESTRQVTGNRLMTRNFKFYHFILL